VVELLDQTRTIETPPRPTATLRRLAREAHRRLGWGIADQAVSSITNFAVSIFIIRILGAVEFGTFSLAYVTYSFVLNASRGLTTDPLLTRFSGTDVPTWRRAVARCTGSALAVGLICGLCTIVVAAVLRGTIGLTLAALGLTFPALLLQDSWRFSFFALGRGGQAFLNDMLWAAALFPALAILWLTGNHNVFWYTFAWGASAGVGAAVGPFQAKVLPKVSEAWQWLHSQRDLGPRYMVEGTANSASAQLRTYGLGLILGLAAIGYVQTAITLMGPFMVVFFGMSLIAVPEAVRAMRRSARHLVIFCVLISAGLSLAAMAWGAVLLVALPLGLGHALLGSIWRSTYPLILPLTISVVGGCVSAGAGAGLHALGQAHRSMRAMIIMSSLYVICALVGAASGGTVGTMIGAAIAAWIGALVFWRELRVALRLPLPETHGIPNGDERQPSEGESSAALAAVPVCKPRNAYRLKAQSRPAVQLLESVPRQRRDGPAPSNGLGPASKAESCT
jgi:O-antigen/teichoic acid export membrane protein